MNDTYRNTDTVAPDLTKRKTVNWPERLITLEGQFLAIQTAYHEAQKSAQYAMMSLAESNERLASHFEDNKRLHVRADGQDEIIEALRTSLAQQEKLLVALLEQNKQLLDFNAGLKRAGWAIVTGGGILIFWLFQKWFEKHGGF